jgi:SPP1 gp7 family putative phage head morphogenesis protein
MSLSWPVPPEFNVRFEEARDWFAKRLGLTVEQLDTMRREAATRATGAVQLVNLQMAFTMVVEIDRAIADGAPFDDFKKELSPMMRRLFGDKTSYVLETMYRNNIQSAYNAGRYKQLMHPDVLATRPYWMFDALLDERTSASCRALDGVIRPANDGFWATQYPPRHHRCRSAVRSMRKDEAEAIGISKNPPQLPPDQGWGELPPQPYQPDLSRYPKELTGGG